MAAFPTFFLPADEGVMAGVPAAILSHEVALGTEAMFSSATR